MGKRNPESYPIRDGMEFGSYSFNDENFDDIKTKLKNLKPEAVGTASTAYKDAAEVLAEMTEELRNNFAKRIIKHWQGDVAQEALDQLGQVYETSSKLSDDSHRNAQLYNWYKVNILDWYKTTGETMEDGYIHTGGDDDRARELMQKFNMRMKEAFDGHPLKITKDLPGEKGGVEPPPPPPPPPGGGGGPFGGGGGGGPFGGGAGGFGGGSGAGAGGNFPTSDGAGAFSPNGGGSGPFTDGGTSPFNPSSPGGGANIPTGDGAGGSPFGTGSGTDLSSFPGGGPGLGGGGGGLGGGLGGGAGGGFGADPGGFGGAGTGSAGGPGGAFGGGPGAAGAGAGAGRAGAGMRGPMGGMPMGHGAQGGKEEERERNTWLTEDEDVWGADDDTAPPVIG